MAAHFTDIQTAFGKNVFDNIKNLITFFERPVAENIFISVIITTKPFNTIAVSSRIWRDGFGNDD